MVAVASPQPNELEQKKRKQTLERAKANHLSKQLQTRLQYAKLKVEHGWQRQNLNEVENLYFHHSHLRNLSLRQGATKQPTYTSTAQADPVPVPVSSGVPDRTLVPSPSANEAPSSGSLSPPAPSLSEQASAADGCPASSSPLVVQTPLVSTHCPPSTIDLSDPNILARLAQLQAHVQISSQPSQNQTQVPTQTQMQTQTLPRQSSTAAPSTATAQPTSLSLSVPIPTSAPFSPGLAFSTHGTQPLYPMPMPVANSPHLASTPSNPGPQNFPSPASTVPTSMSVPTTTTPPIPILIPPTSIAPSALTYDSFWSTHASSTGPTRALYRTHTGFTASAAPGGNVAMLTPGGHAAVMTAEGVYVGGGKSG